MLKLIQDLPPHVLGIEAAGKVTHEDYRKVLIPAAEADDGQGFDPDAVHHRPGVHRLRARRPVG